MLGRLFALTALATLLACGGEPAALEAKSPKSERGSDEARAERKRKKAEERRRKEQEEADAREAEEREERRRKREAEEGAQETRVAEKEKEESPPATEDPDEIERRERKERIRKREEAEAKAEAKAKKTKKKQKKVEEADEPAEEVAEEEPKAKKKKNVEEVEEADEEVAEEETKSSPFKKKEPKQTAAQKKAAEKKAAAEAKKQAAAEKKAAEEEKRQAAAEKKAAAEAEKKAAAEAKKQAAAEKKKASEEKVSDEAEEEPAEEEAPKVTKSDKRKAKAKEPEEKVDESEIEVDTASLPPPDPSEESNELDLTAGTPKRDEDEVVVAPVMLAIDRRPLTLGRGKINVHGGLVATAVTVPTGMMGATTSASSQGLALGATYGIGAKGELGFDYTLGLHPGDLQGPLLFHAAYVAKQNEKLDIALSLGLAIDFVDSTDPMTMMTSTRAAKGLQVGVWARYHLGAKISAFTGLPALPSSAGNLGKSAPLPPIPYQLSIGLSSLDAIALDLPAGLGFQASPKLYTFGALDLARLGMNNATSALIFSDFIPISLGGFYAMPKMDIGAVFSDDLKQAADYLRFDVVVRYSIK